MARNHDAGSQLPSPNDDWDFALSYRATLKDFDHTPLTDAIPQYRGPAFEPSYTSASYPTPGVGSYQQTNTRGGVPYGINYSDAHYSANGPPYGYNQLNSNPIIPGLTDGYEYHYPLDEAEKTAMVPHDTQNGHDVINHVDTSFFAGILSDGLESHVGSALLTVDDVNASILDMPSNSSPETFSPSSDASSSQTRFACHHPQCRGHTFGRRADRDRHARVHDDVRPFECSKANCTRKFYRRDKLQSHLERGH